MNSKLTEAITLIDEFDRDFRADEGTTLSDTWQLLDEVANALQAARAIDDSTLYSLNESDVDSVLEGRKLTDTQRDACYRAVEHLDSSSIFEEIGVLVDITLEDV